MKLTIFSIMAMTMSMALMYISYFLPKRLMDLKKKAPYECGFDPMNSARLPFSFRFFLMAILFLMFDLEMALLFPIMTSLNKDIYYLLVLSCMFLIILGLGLAYEWDQGGLEWAE